MNLKDIYKLSEIIRKNVEDETLPQDIFDNMEIILKFDPTIYYGIDKEFYYLTHNNSYEGFVHSEDLVTANVDGLKFNILPKRS